MNKIAPKKQQFETLMQMMSAFPDEQTAIDHFTAIRWKAGAYCPTCGSTKIYHFADKRTHKCGDCRKRFSIKVGTIFEDSKIGLRQWMIAIWLITSHKKGIASTQLAKDIGVTQKTAWFMLHRLRYAAQTKSFNRPLTGEIEADETFIGGKEKNKHAWKRTGGKQGGAGKAIVLGMLERDGELRTGTTRDLTEENKRLASAARGAGVQTTTDFAIFQNKGIQGLYGGMGVREIQDYKGLGSKAKILDHMGSTELAANLFRITQTEEKLRSRVISRKEDANRAHYEVGQKVRQTMSELSGILPEDLPVAEDVKRLAAAERKQQKQRALAIPTQPQTKLAAPSPVAIDLREDLWKYALLIMSVRPNGEISTSDMIAEMPGYVHLSDEHTAANSSRKDSKFSQIVRNLKSHKNTRTNFIYQGYAQDVRGGFKITRKGLDFVREYFKN